MSQQLPEDVVNEIVDMKHSKIMQKAQNAYDKRKRELYDTATKWLRDNWDAIETEVLRTSTNHINWGHERYVETTVGILLNDSGVRNAVGYIMQTEMQFDGAFFLTPSELKLRWRLKNSKVP